MRPGDLTALRKLIQEKTWKIRKAQQIAYGQARSLAVVEVSQGLGMTAEYVERILSEDMIEQRAKQIEAAKAEVRPFDFVDEEPERLVFYDDYSNSSPKKDLIVLADRLRPMKVGGVKACLFDKIEEATATRKMVSKVVKQLGWKNSRANPGYIAEVIAAGKKFKLRVERLR